MSLISNSIAQIKRIIFTILGVIRRAFCCRRFRKLSNSDSILPVTIKSGSYTPNSGQQINDQVNLNQRQFSQFSQVNNSWQSWDRQNSSFGNPPVAAPNPVQQFVPGTNSGPQNESGDMNNDDDYFRDMMPTIKKQKKVLLKTSSPQSSFDLEPKLDKFNFEPSTNFGAHDVQEQGAWDEEEIQLEDSLREAREAKRTQRMLEHQRMKEKRSKTKSGNFSATKLT